MGKKKVQDVKPEESGSFLAGQIQPTAPSRAEGIEQTETKDIVEQLKKMFINKVLEKINNHLDEKIKFLNEEEKIFVLYKLNKLARYDADMVKALDILVSPLPEFSKKIKEI
jgi:excinuclease UvrABC helicase subunit UvrB